MQLSTYGNEAQVSGVEHTQAFQMQMNSKMFSILTDKLYQNKEGAVIRELSSNARDAHVASGKADIPFELTLPSWLSTEFKIRDFGTGIDPEDFYDIYTNLGQSTKDNDNTAIGAYGLGSKTPFAVTDSYTIRNFWNGTVYVYAAFKDAGMPTVSLLGSEATDEVNGLEISVDVSRPDPASFVRECAKQLAYFEVKPTIVNIDDFKWNEVDDLSKGYHTQSGYYNQQITIVMGGIPYSASTDDLNMEIRDLLRRTRVVLVAELGEVDIPPSRESLELTAKTLSFIDAKITEISKNYKTDFAKSVSEAANIVELYVALSVRNTGWLSVGTFNHTMYEYKGENILGENLLEIVKDSGDKLGVIYKENTSYYKNLKTMSCDMRYLLNTMSSRDAQPRAKWKVYLNDISPKANKLINEERSSLTSGVPVLFSTERKTVNYAAAVNKLEVDLKVIGLLVVRLSTVITVPVVVKGAKKVAYDKPNQVFRVDTDGCIVKYATTLPLPTEGYYVSMSNWSMTETHQYLSFIRTHLGHAVYALRSDAVKSVVKSGNMTCVSKLRDDVIKKLTELSAVKDQARANYSEIQTQLGSNHAIFDSRHLKRAEHLPNGNQVKVLLETCVAAAGTNDAARLSSSDVDLGKQLNVVSKDVAHNLKPKVISILKYAKENYILILEKTLSNTRFWQEDKGHISQLLTLITGSIK